MRYFSNRYKDVVSGSAVQVDRTKWIQAIESTVNTITSNMAPSSVENCDGGLYVGNAGIAYMLYRLSRSELLRPELRQTYTKLCGQYLATALAYSESSNDRDPPTSFLLGKAGVYALGTVIASHVGDGAQAEKLAQKYSSIGELCKPIKIFPYGSDEFFVGRAGYLAGSLFINESLGKQVKKKKIIYFCFCLNFISFFSVEKMYLFQYFMLLKEIFFLFKFFLFLFVT